MATPYLVLFDFENGSTQLSAGSTVFDDQVDIAGLQRSGCSLVAKITGMDAQVTAYLNARKTPGVGAAPNLMALLLAAQLIGGGAGTITTDAVTNLSSVPGTTATAALNALLAAIPSVPVASVFGRIGVVVAAGGDYTSTLITNASGVAGATVTGALNALAAAIPSVPVSSVFGRIGAVTAAAGDYTSTQVSNSSGVVGATTTDALNTLLAALPTSGPIASVFGRTGTVVSATNDYAASQVQNDSTVVGTGVAAALNTLSTGKVPTSRTITTTSPLSGGGDLSADRTLTIAAATDSVNGYLTSTDHVKLTAADVTAFTDGSIPYVATAKLAQNNAQLFWDAVNARLGVGINSGLTAKVQVALGTITTDLQALALTATWNAAVTFTAIKATITETSSNTGSKFVEFFGGALGTTSLFAVRNDSAIALQASQLISGSSAGVLALQVGTAVAAGVTVSTTGVATSGNRTLLTVTAAADTAQTASTEKIDVDFALARTLQFATGAKATQRAFVVRNPTYSAVGATTITNAATVAIVDAPTAGTNVTLTNAYALWVQAGNVRFAGTVLNLSAANAQIFLGPTCTMTIASNQTTMSADANGWIFTKTLSASGTAKVFTVTAVADTLQTAATEKIDFDVNLARTVQFLTGALATQRASLFRAPTYGFTGASTIAMAATVAIDGPPAAGTNTTLTETVALWVQTGSTKVGGLFYGSALHNNATALTGTTRQYVGSGTYTPTLTNVTNVTSSTAAKCQYTRVGNVVTVTGSLSVTPTLAALATIGISLPIASNLALATDCAGAAAAIGVSMPGSISGDTANDRAQLDTVAAVGANVMYFTFSYEVL